MLAGTSVQDAAVAGRKLRDEHASRSPKRGMCSYDKQRLYMFSVIMPRPSQQTVQDKAAVAEP